jgi:3-oxoacyl-[acyl-carrier protein] reductase
MDLGISGRRALVCASSKGLGLACAISLAREGGRDHDRTRGGVLEAAAQQVRAATGATVTTVAGDITTPEGRALALAACPAPDILVTNAGGPKPGDFREWSREDWIAAIDANMLTPIALIKATVDGMMQRGFDRIVNITSGAVKAPIDILGLSNGARSGLTGFVAGLARTTVARNVTINNLLPGPFETERLLATAAAAHAAAASRQRTCWLPAVRPTRPAASASRPNSATPVPGCAAPRQVLSPDKTCSDGGAYPGTF